MFSSIWGSNYLSVIHFCIEICYCSSTGCPMILHENSKKIAQWWFYARIILHRCEIITWWPKNSHWKCLHCHQSHLHRSLHIFSLIHCFTQSEKHQLVLSDRVGDWYQRPCQWPQNSKNYFRCLHTTGKTNKRTFRGCPDTENNIWGVHVDCSSAPRTSFNGFQIPNFDPTSYQSPLVPLA